MNDHLPKAEPDFLQRLVSRALDEDFAIEPRLPSLFEPATVSPLEPGAAWQDNSASVLDQAVQAPVLAGDVEAARPSVNADRTATPGHDVGTAAEMAKPGHDVQSAAATPMPRHDVLHAAARPKPTADFLETAATARPGQDGLNATATPMPGHDVLPAPTRPEPTADFFGTAATAWPGQDGLNATATPRRAEPIQLAVQADLRLAAEDRQFEPPPMPPSSPQPAAAARRRSPPSRRVETDARANDVRPKAVDVVIGELHPAAGDATPFKDSGPIAVSDHREESPQSASRDRSGINRGPDSAVPANVEDKRGTLVPVPTGRIAVAPLTARDRPPRDQAAVVPADAAPVINVTIGRLEVRAAPAAPMMKPRSEKRGAQPMSLDDYFKQRRGER